MLKNLSESQLMEVQQFIASLQSSVQPAPTVSMVMTQQEQNVNGMNNSKQQMSGMSTQQTGGVPIQTQNVVAHENSMPPPQMTSFQQPNQMQGMTSSMNGMQNQMNSQQPMMQQHQPTQMYAQQPTMQQPAPSQLYAQQQSTQAQGMGSTAMPQLSMKQQPMASNMGSAHTQPQQQVPNQSMMQPMGSSQPYAPSPTMASMTPPPNNLAPVEKEGNPFDMY